MSKRRAKNYTLEFKQSSANLAVTSGQPVSQTAKDLGVNVNTLHGWVTKYHPNKTTGVPGLPDNDSLVEIKRLRKENARLRQERDILKKASAYFASETL